MVAWSNRLLVPCLAVPSVSVCLSRSCREFCHACGPVCGRGHGRGRSRLCWLRCCGLERVLSPLPPQLPRGTSCYTSECICIWKYENIMFKRLSSKRASYKRNFVLFWVNWLKSITFTRRDLDSNIWSRGLLVSCWLISFKCNKSIPCNRFP